MSGCDSMNTTTDDTVHLFRCEYDDLHKFEWPVLIDSELNLWLDVVCLHNIIHQKLLPPVRSLSKWRRLVDHRLDVDVATRKVVVADSVVMSTEDVGEQYQFCRAQDLTSAPLEDTHKTMVEQFVFQQLPYYLDMHVNTLHLISLFDITDYWNVLTALDRARKYWLFRLKIVTMKYENEKKGASYKRVNNQNDKLVDKSVDTVVNYQSVADESELIREKEKNFKFSESPNDEVGLVNQLQDHNLVLCDNICRTIEVQFKSLNNTYKSVDKMHVLSSFNKLLKGSVGLLEVLLQWS
ncbi:ORF33 similar to XcGV ORF29 [Cydia pomonella granulovirus]|uniref:ORF33 n=2 Tax=Cydia pomonella granulosis virus TaxID=28289 RepID=A0A097P1S3_GVCP|nr:ORF33 similar to XcGV ORF29 [Cydia pomonella granulovirus]AAK70693.1 ORF33 similar to XcGV ORF29 [Cydia pomonella granulovirus]AIU36679.1 ORF33 [Cydia pomonella granulovirus]AIU36958.1 ORF33 [Cydia pomonella granulovirus]AIU37100.1 ORF33 [Cydia pomonella granulovirus]AIU37241.1 ORF33 [Cydia pomonella granulovirus]